MLDALRCRFEANRERHEGLSWDDVEQCLAGNPSALETLRIMEETGGEPDALLFPNGSIALCDCSKESPSGRRSLCYDEAARAGRKRNPPRSSAEEQARHMGAYVMDEAQYRYLQTLGEFDLKTSSWISTPAEIRKLGGALFCERRYGAVFTFHNGADSYYGSRGWRAVLILR